MFSPKEHDLVWTDGGNKQFIMDIMGGGGVGGMCEHPSRSIAVLVSKDRVGNPTHSNVI